MRITKRNFVNTILLIVALLVLAPTVMKDSGTKESSNYLSEANMKSSISGIQSYLSAQFSSSSSSKYKGTATVETSDGSDIGLVLTNISQTTMNDKWNANHTWNYQVDGTCGLVALDIMIQKYMTLVTGKLPNSDSAYGVFNKLVQYAFDSKIFPNDGTANGTSLAEQEKIADYYLKTYQKNKYSSDKDKNGLWGTITSYIDNKVRPLKLGLTGEDEEGKVGHAVIASAYYIETVTYQQKNVFGNWKTYTKDYKVLRICDGYTDSEKTQWNKTTNKFIFFDCVKNLIKFK